jgi:hypothetical protein
MRRQQQGQGQPGQQASSASSSSAGDLLPFGLEDVISFGADDVERIDQFVALLKQGGGGEAGGRGGAGPAERHLEGEQSPQEWARQKLWTVCMINLVG